MNRSVTFATFTLFVLASLFTHAPSAPGQNQGQPQKSPTPEDVVRVNTSLVQTDVMVFDKQGQFVDNLKPEQFELKVDGKPVPLSFFERVVAGSAGEATQLEAAGRAGGGSTSSGSSSVAAKASVTAIDTADRGRTILFFVDDYHLASDSLVRTRRMLQRFIETDLQPNDRAALSSTSDQIGFLQQLTNDKTVLKAAIERLANRSKTNSDPGFPPMNEYQALAITRGERDVLDYFVDQLLKQSLALTRPEAEEMATARASALAERGIIITTNTLIALDNFARAAARLPGRKLVFFVSDGFFLESQNSSSYDRLRRITDAAARAGVVIYSMDARGLSTGAADASTGGDTSSRLSRTTLGEVAAAQDVLNALAADTGGRALLNSNDLDAAVRRALKETSVYYLLAWRPDPEAMQSGKARRVEISVVGRPDLKVRMRRGFNEAASLTTPNPNAAAGNLSISNPGASSAAAIEEELKKAVGAAVPVRDLPTSLVVAYTDTPGSGASLIVSTQVSSPALAFDESGGKQTAAIDLLGLVFDKQGKQVSNFRKRVSFNPASSDLFDPAHKLVFYNHQANLAPGLYQVRVAARDAKSGSVGSAMQWIEVPDLASGKLALSSLLLVEQGDEQSPAAQGVKKGVTQRFRRDSRLRFMLYIYNSAYDKSGGDEPDVTLQIQVLRGSQQVVNLVAQDVLVEGVEDFTRLPYTGEVPFAGLPPGEYTLQVDVTDQTSKATAVQRAAFIIE